MTKLNTNLFTVESLDQEVLDGISSYIDWANSFTDEVVRMSRNNMTLEDNVYSKKLRVTLKHNVWQEVDISAPVYGVTPMRCYEGNDCLLGTHWRFNKEGKVLLYPYFANSTDIATGRLCDLIIWRG